jgi:uncharacterized metal-binding protein YceD (DUF177 family)
MTPDPIGPLSRPFPVETLPEDGAEVTVEATEEERTALARDFKLPAIHSLAGHFRITGTPRRLKVAGRVEARVRQVCVVTLEEFDSDLSEEVEVDFSTEPGRSEGPAAGEADPPDPIVGGQVDLGALTAEFMALGLDPHPRKPGAEFQYEDSQAGRDSPFAGLAGRLGKDR